MGSVRWIVSAIGFTVAACLFIAASALLLYLVSERGGRFIDSERLRSLLALGLFVLVIAVPTYLLAVADTDSKRS